MSSPGVALGVVDDFVYVERRQDKLQPGDVIFVGTDGIWETFDSDAHQYGKDRLERIVKENIHAPVAIIGDSVLADVHHRHKPGVDCFVRFANYSLQLLQVILDCRQLAAYSQPLLPDLFFLSSASQKSIH